MDNAFELHPALQGAVKNGWVLEQSLFIFRDDPLLPDPYAPLVVNCGAPLVMETADGQTVELPPVIINGLQSKPLRLKTDGEVAHVALNLYPWAIPALVETPTYVAGTSVIALGGPWDDQAQTVKALVRRGDQQGALDCLQEFVSRLLRPKPAFASVRAAGEMLYAARGQAQLSDLAAHCFLSPSQVERHFKHQLGMSPKAFARLIRFDAVRDSLISNPAQRPLDLALEFGYSDQAHFIHEFKSFAARTPGEYARALLA